MVWHRSISGQDNLYLNATDGTSTVAADPISVPGFPSSLSTTVFTVDVGTDSCNTNGATYVALLFAHNAGGFGLTGTDNVISCGSYTGSASAVDVNLGYEAQFVMVKNITTGSTNWVLLDTMRGMPLSGTARTLNPNLSDAEGGLTAPVIVPTATGFTVASGVGTSINTSGNTYIYIAIRRGPMRVPTDATKVFAPIARTGTGAAATVTGVGFPSDLTIINTRANLTDRPFFDRLRGATNWVTSVNTGAENTASDTLIGFDSQDGYRLGTDSTLAVCNVSSRTYINYSFRRAPQFFDEVCYTGTGSVKTETHNLGAVPELMIVKRRSLSGDWMVYSSILSGANKYLQMNTGAAELTDTTVWNSTAPTASVFTIGTKSEVNSSTQTYVCWLAASCPGVSKVGSFTGTGSTLQINCGFTAGARFVLIKRTDSTGDWYVWDSARGIVAGNDPYLLLNSTAAEVTTTDWVDTYSLGFELSNAGGNNVNINTASYIFLAIA
jgi:hypothetical protein